MDGFYIFLIILGVYIVGVIVCEAIFTVWNDSSDGMSILWPLVAVMALIYFPCRWTWRGLIYSLMYIRWQLDRKREPESLPDTQPRLYVEYKLGTWK